MRECVLSHVLFFATPSTVAGRALLSMVFPGKNTEMDCHFLLQGFFPTQRLNLCILPWQVDSPLLHHLGIPLRVK